MLSLPLLFLPPGGQAVSHHAAAAQQRLGPRLAAVAGQPPQGELTAGALFWRGSRAHWSGGAVGRRSFRSPLSSLLGHSNGTCRCAQLHPPDNLKLNQHCSHLYRVPQVGVSNLSVKGTVRIAIKPLLDELPVAGGIKVKRMGMGAHSARAHMRRASTCVRC